MNNHTCTNPEIGVMLAAFEIGVLDAADRSCFLAHVRECSFCQQELDTMLPLWMEMNENRTALQEAMDAAEMSFNLIKQRLVAESKQPESLPDKIRRSLGFMKNRLEELLDFEPLPAPALVLRGQAKESNEAWEAGMTAYRSQQYDVAVSKFALCTSREPARWDAWLFLGISRLMQKKATPAIRALEKADSLSGLAMKVEIRWYLAQAWLLKGDAVKATPYLAELAVSESDQYKDKARELLRRLKEIQDR